MKRPNNEHIHMKFIKPFMVLCGIWPLEITGIKLFLYNCYFYLSFTYFVLNVCTLYVPARGVVLEGDLAEITTYFSDIIFASILVYKAATYRSSGVKELLKRALKFENHLFGNDDDEAKKVYMDNIASTNYLSKIYVTQGCVASNCGELFPLICTVMSAPDEQGNKPKYFIVSSWEPFDKYEYYYSAYFIQLVFTKYAEMYIVFCGTFFLFILNCMVGQLLVLQHRFRTVHKNAIILSKKNGISFRDACNTLVKECIQQHQDIIGFVEHADNTFRRYIMFDYMCTSFGLSLVALTFLLEKTVQMKIQAAGYFAAFAAQSLLIYYHADIVAIQSSYGLSQAIFASNWYELDVSAQKLLTFVIARAQKPLTLSIGPFRKVGVESMIALFKATYSYLSVMWE